MSTEQQGTETFGDAVEKGVSSPASIFSTAVDLAIGFNPIGMAANIVSSIVTGDSIGTHLTGASSVQDAVGDHVVASLTNSDQATNTAVARVDIVEEDIEEEQTEAYTALFGEPAVVDLAALSVNALQSEIQAEINSQTEIMAGSGYDNVVPGVGVGADSEGSFGSSNVSTYGDGGSWYEASATGFGYDYAGPSDLGTDFASSGTDFGYDSGYDSGYSDYGGGDMASFDI